MVGGVAPPMHPSGGPAPTRPLPPGGSLRAALEPFEHAADLAKVARARRAAGLPVHGEGWDGERGRWIHRVVKAAEEARRLTVTAEGAGLPATAARCLARAWRLAWAEACLSPQRNLVAAPSVVRGATEAFAAALPSWLGGGSTLAAGSRFVHPGHAPPGPGSAAPPQGVLAKRLLRTPEVLRLTGLLVHLCRERCIPLQRRGGGDVSGSGSAAQLRSEAAAQWQALGLAWGAPGAAPGREARQAQLRRALVTWCAKAVAMAVLRWRYPFTLGYELVRGAAGARFGDVGVRELAVRLGRGVGAGCDECVNAPPPPVHGHPLWA